MIDKVFLDTNILIYSIDKFPAEKKKRTIARQLIKEHIKNGTGVISIQVIQEFYQVATRKIQKTISSAQALEYLNYISVLETIQSDFDMVVAAIHTHQLHSISFWDALILQAAKIAECTLLLSEDLQDGFQFENLQICNPFK